MSKDLEKLLENLDMAQVNDLINSLNGTRLNAVNQNIAGSMKELIEKVDEKDGNFLSLNRNMIASLLAALHQLGADEQLLANTMKLAGLIASNHYPDRAEIKNMRVKNKAENVVDTKFKA